MMASKRSHPDGGGPSAKKHASALYSDGPVASVEELNKRTLRHQNRKLVELIDIRKKAESDLRGRIEQLEQRLTTDDDVLMIVNRYWNQLDEDVRVLLQRFDADTADVCEEEAAPTTAFIALLSTWDKDEMNEKLQQRVEFSKRAVSKLIQAFDRLLLRHNKLTTVTLLEESLKTEQNDGGKLKEEKPEVKYEPKAEGEEEKDTTTSKDDQKSETEESEKDQQIKTFTEELAELSKENARLQEQATSLHQRHHVTTGEFNTMREQIERLETGMAEMKNKCDDLQYERDNATERVHKYQHQLSEAHEELARRAELLQGGGSTTGSERTEQGLLLSRPGVKSDDIKLELETQTQLAESRLAELESLQKEYQQSEREKEQLIMDLKSIPKLIVEETTEYKCLKSQYSVLFNEAQQIKTQLEEARALLTATKTVQNHHIEKMESDELASQRKLRSELIGLEEALGKVRREYELSRVELEQTQAANEQAGPINREMRNLIQSLQGHHRNTKNEISRYKRMYKTAQDEIKKLKEQLEKEDTVGQKTSEAGEDTEPIDTRPAKEISVAELTGKKDPLDEQIEREKTKGKPDKDILSNMKQQLKKSQDSQRELKLLLDMYKSAPKEQRDKVQLMRAEREARQEVDDLKEHIKSLRDSERKEKRKLADGEALKKIKRYEEQIAELRKEIGHQKQEEEVWLNEMEVTGQAYEEKQEQNVRLVQQLKEKDDANFKLMSESIKSKHINSMLKEENELLQEQIATLTNQREAMNAVIRRLEDKERLLQSAMQTMEKELTLRQQGMESFKRKAMENAQTAADLKLHLEKYHSQLKEAQTAAADKAQTLDQQSFKYRRISEELAIVKKKYERSQKIEQMGNTDEVLLEEIREYKEQLTCPSCKVKKKDAVLTKCFHVFCLECLKTRYETRQRKCPKCNAAFGANDYHRIYIS